MSDVWDVNPRESLRAGADFDLASFDRSSTPGYDGKKADGKEDMEARGELLSELQERLFAHGRSGGTKSVLLVVQGLDTAGKGGIVRHVMGMVDPQGVALASFGVPTKEELSHHFLWRIKKELPGPGQIGVFDRSHYEDVLVQRVEKIVKEDVWRKRYKEINNFEKRLVEGGTTIIKVALMCSKDEQAARIMERIKRPDKKWKHNPGDLDTRAKWDQYQQAYQDVFTYTSTDVAPWYVIPADRKWFARLAVTELLTQALIDLDLSWPTVRWKEDVQIRRLLATVDDEVAREILAEAVDAKEEATAEDEEFRAEVEEVSDPVGTDAPSEPTTVNDKKDSKDKKNKKEKKDKKELSASSAAKNSKKKKSKKKKSKK